MMTHQKPTFSEIKDRICEHRNARPNNDLVSAVWHGYLAALQEWGLLDDGLYAIVLDYLDEPGALEAVEILATPEYLDEHPEFRERIRQSWEIRRKEKTGEKPG